MISRNGLLFDKITLPGICHPAKYARSGHRWTVYPTSHLNDWEIMPPLTKGELDGALADCNKAIELNPKDAPSYAIRGGVKYKKGDTNGAQADFKTAIELNPKMQKVIEAKGYLTNRTNSNLF